MVQKRKFAAAPQRVYATTPEAFPHPLEGRWLGVSASFLRRSAHHWRYAHHIRASVNCYTATEQLSN